MEEFFHVVWEARFFSLPVILAYLWWDIRLYFLRARFIRNIKWVLLEIKIPRDIPKNPRAFEIIFNALHVSRKGNLIQQYWYGRVHPWFSLEMASHSGHVHFYVYSWSEYRALVEHQIYAQYPDVEITEVDNYTRSPAFGDPARGEWSYFGSEFVLAKESAYPIRTYVDYGLDKEGIDEPEKNDPIPSFIEFMGSLPAGSELWYQVLIRAAGSDWKKQGTDLVDKLLQRGAYEKKDVQSLGFLRLSPGETDVAKAIERKSAKIGYEIGIRAIYLGRKGIFDPANISAMLGLLKQYATQNLNGFKPVNITTRNYILVERRESVAKRRILDAYRHRSWFYTPHRRKISVLNTEELATIYHFPGRVSETPTLRRIEAKKSEPPMNLPI